MSGCAKSELERTTAAPESAPAPLSITLAQAESEAWLMNRFEVSIRNTGEADVVILKPLDGSLWSWHLPFYQFTVKDLSGEMLTMGSRCGNSGLWADTEWPDDYLLVLKPGEQFKKTFALYYAVPEEGEYQVQFQYIMDLTADPSKGRYLRYPEQVWKGSVSSETKTYKLKEQKL